MDMLDLSLSVHRRLIIQVQISKSKCQMNDKCLNVKTFFILILPLNFEL